MTHKSIGSVINSNVLANGRILWKVFMAMGAFIRSINHVSFNMLLEFGGALISLRTKWAFAKPIARIVCFNVHHEGGGRL